MKKREAINLYNFLNSMQEASLELATSEWKTLSDNRVALQDVLKDIDDSRRELVRKYSNDDPEAELVKVDEAQVELFEKDYLELLEEETDLALETISIDNIGDKMSSQVGIWEFMRFMVSK
jgi:hypothetical protein